MAHLWRSVSAMGSHTSAEASEARTLLGTSTLEDGCASLAEAHSRRRFARAGRYTALAAATAAACTLSATLAWQHARAPSKRTAGLSDSIVEDGVKCAESYTEDCRSTPCCREFDTCYEKDEGFATCKATCALGAPDSAPAWDPDADLKPWSCKVVGSEYMTAPDWQPSADLPSLYCFLVTLVKGNEPELMRRHLASGTGVFGCNEYDMFSEREMIIGPGPRGLVKSTAIGGPMAHSPKNNTQDFLRAWRKVIEKDCFNRHDWTLKIDPDAVFFAEFLRPKLIKHAIATETDDVYFRNCHKWKSVQGPLELFSKAAARKFFGNLDACVKLEVTMKEPGEDWFFGHCIDHLGVRSIEDYELLDDQWCTSKPASCGNGMAAFHPFKTTERYEECLEKANHAVGQKASQEQRFA